MRLQHTLGVLLTTLLLLLALSACSSVPRLAAIPDEDVPVALREHMAERRGDIRDLVWRALYEQDGQVVAVLTYSEIHSYTSPLRGWSSQQSDYVEWLVHRDAAGDHAHNLRIRVFRDWEPYFWRQNVKMGLEYGDRSIYALGWAHGDQAHTVLAKTTRGRVFEAPVVNGFWFMFVAEPIIAEIFETVVVRDQQGSTIHTY